MWGERWNTTPWDTSRFHRYPLLVRSPQLWLKWPICSWFHRQSRQGWRVVSRLNHDRTEKLSLAWRKVLGSSADQQPKKEKHIMKKKFTPFVSYGQVMKGRWDHGILGKWLVINGLHLNIRLLLGTWLHLQFLQCSSSYTCQSWGEHRGKYMFVFESGNIMGSYKRMTKAVGQQCLSIWMHSMGVQYEQSIWKYHVEVFSEPGVWTSD